jgi:hypothetical protein
MRLFLTFTVLFFSFLNLVTSQNENVIDFDFYIGLENTGLHNGQLYNNPYRISRENHNFFDKPNFQKGNITYDNQNYFNVDLKYDLLEDQLILKPDGAKSFLNITLILNKISRFNLELTSFINTNSLEIINESSAQNLGITEIIYETESILYLAKQKKIKRTKIVNNTTIDLFTNTSIDYYIYYEANLIQIKTHSDLKNIFPNYSEIINEAHKKNKSLKKKDKTSYFKNILFQIEIALNNKL